MSFHVRIALAATMTLAIAGLAVRSTAGLAAEVVPSALTVTQPAYVPMVPNPVIPAESDEAVTNGDAQAGDVTVYPTLAAAVAAQPANGTVDENLRCLAGAIYYESKGEPLAGQLAVAEVILNRADNGRFADSICGVVTQPGQFSFVRGGRIPAVDPERPAWRTALAVARVALDDAWESDAGEALYFHARRAAPGWGRVKVASIGNHVFYR